METLKQNFKVQIFATDIDSRAIEQARAGVYPASIAADISPERLARFFTQEPDGSAYRIQKSIRDMLVFSEQDVIKDPPFSKLDLISCRNLLIYMDAELQKKLIPLFHYALEPGRHALPGHLRDRGRVRGPFRHAGPQVEAVPAQRGCSPAHRRRIGQFLPLLPEQATPAHGRPGRRPGESKLPLRELTEQTLLQQLRPGRRAGQRAGDILYLHGRTGKYWNRPRARPA